MNSNRDTPLRLRQFGGHRTGPRLLITAGVHGDEYLPMLAVKNLIGRFEANRPLRSQLRGTVVLIPVVNRPAYLLGRRCGHDHLDLARCCPGREHGSPTEQIAFALSRQIRDADFYIDLHTGGTELCVLPLAGYVLHPDSAVLEQQRRLASAFQLPLLWGTSAELQGRSLSVARDAGVPAIYVEYLGAHRELSEVASGVMHSGQPDHPFIAGCLNVMRQLGMIDGSELATVEQETIEDWRPDSGHLQICNPAPASGFLRSHVRLGQHVSGGELLAQIVSENEDRIESVESMQEGKVVVLRDYPRIKQGDCVAVIAEHFEAT